MKYSHQVRVREVRELQALRVIQVIRGSQNLLVGPAVRETPGRPETNTAFTPQMNPTSSFQWLPDATRKCYKQAGLLREALDQLFVVCHSELSSTPVRTNKL